MKRFPHGTTIKLCSGSSDAYTESIPFETTCWIILNMKQIFVNTCINFQIEIWSKYTLIKYVQSISISKFSVQVKRAVFHVCFFWSDFFFVAFISLCNDYLVRVQMLKISINVHKYQLMLQMSWKIEIQRCLNSMKQKTILLSTPNATQPRKQKLLPSHFR